MDLDVSWGMEGGVSKSCVLP